MGAVRRADRPVLRSFDALAPAERTTAVVRTGVCDRGALPREPLVRSTGRSAGGHRPGDQPQPPPEAGAGAGAGLSWRTGAGEGRHRHGAYAAQPPFRPLGHTDQPGTSAASRPAPPIGSGLGAPPRLPPQTRNRGFDRIMQPRHRGHEPERGTEHACRVTRSGRPPSTARAPRTRPAPRSSPSASAPSRWRHGRAAATSTPTPPCAPPSRRRGRPASPSTRSRRRSSGGRGDLEGVRYESINYEGYGPGGVAIMVETLTRQPQSHRRRDAQRLQPQRRQHGRARRRRLAVRAQGHRDRRPRQRRGQGHGDRHGGRRRGHDEQRRGLGRHQRARPTSSRCARPSTTPASRPSRSTSRSSRPPLVPVPDEAEAKKVLRLLEAIDDHDDVQAVHSNADIPDEVLAAFEG